MTKTQKVFFLFPFLGAILFAYVSLFTGRIKYFGMMLSFLPAAGMGLAVGATLGIIGLFAYTVTKIISIIVMGLVWNFVFFRSWNKREKKRLEKQ